MKERPENLNAVEGESEATLVTPRFDAEEARRAHPVVPLAEASAHARRGPRRPWTPALLVVVLLASVAVGGVVASKVLRREQPKPAADAQPPVAAAPVQATAAPAEAQTPSADDVPREVATKPEARAPRVTRPRRVEDASVPARVETARDDDRDFEDEDAGRRGKRHGKHRARVEDDGDKEFRQVLKDAAKKKAPRLVDVLVKP